MRDKLWGRDQIKPDILMVTIVMGGLKRQDMEAGCLDDMKETVECHVSLKLGGQS